MRNARFASAMTAIAAPNSLTRFRDSRGRSLDGLNQILPVDAGVRGVGGICPWMFFFEPMCRHLPVEPGPVHRVNVGVEDHMIEGPDEESQRCQNRFIEMYGGGDGDQLTRNPRRDARAIP